MKRLLCECGEKVVRKDVVQQEYFVRQFGPSFVYVKYRCPRCNRMGEQYVRQEDWMPAALETAIVTALEAAVEPYFPSHGPITEDEQSSVRDFLTRSNPLDSLKLFFHEN
jgi:hypothetical protein